MPVLLRHRLLVVLRVGPQGLPIIRLIIRILNVPNYSFQNIMKDQAMTKQLRFTTQHPFPSTYRPTVFDDILMALLIIRQEVPQI